MTISFAAYAAKEDKMIYPTRTIEVFPRDNEHCKRLKDPSSATLFHMEAFLPFTEAVKLEKGNANLRPPSERKKPFMDMVATVQDEPSSFHKKNRGITYLCDKFEYDNAKKRLQVSIPDVPKLESETNGEDDPRFGIADGGHTFEVIRQTVDRMNELKEDPSWTEPFVRVHFLAGEAVVSGEIEMIVEALNTSSQVQQYTLDEYQNKFDDLKKALSDTGFDTSLIAFRENEEREWDIREIIQRMACFLKDRWKFTQPTSMYRSKGKALDLFTNDLTRPDFEKLYGVVRDVITLPEFIQSQFSQGDIVEGKRFGGLRAVRNLKKAIKRPGTDYLTKHQMDLAASLPLAAAFRELLELRNDRYVWKVQPEEVFEKCAEELYKVLASKSRTAKSVNSLGSDTELWTQAVNIVLRTKDDLLAAAPRTS
jgi:AIPR protein